MTTREALRGLLEALREMAAEGCCWEGSYKDCFEAIANPDEVFDVPCPACRSAAAIAALEKERERLVDDVQLVLTVAKAIETARNDPRKWTNTDMAEAAVVAIDAHLFGAPASDATPAGEKVPT